MAWHERGDEPLSIRCPGGTESPSHEWGPVSANVILAQLRQAGDRIGRDLVGFHDHVSDPIAMHMRYLSILGWTTIGPGRMLCPMCRKEVE